MTDTTVIVPDSDSELSNAAPHLTIQEKLLLAQAVYKLGAVSWPGVSNLLVHHPCCIARPAELFSAEKCESVYVELMTSIGINVPAPDAIKAQAKVHLRLAQTFYLARMQELQAQIASYEARFSQLMKEISALRAGEMNGEIRAELRATLARKYGKKLLDTWVPDEAEVKMAIEKGPIKEDEAEDKYKNEAVEDSAVENVRTPDAEVTEGKVDVDEEQLEEQPEVEPETTSKNEPIRGTEEEAEVDEKEATQVDASEEKDEGAQKTHSREASSAPSARSELSPAPGSDLSSAPSEKRTPTPAPEIEPASSRRSYKRRASTQPRDAPAPKRSGRRSAAVPTTPQPETEAEAEDVDMEEDKVEEVEAEIEAEEQEQEVPATRGRRGARRERESSSRAPPSSKKPQNSPSASTRTKDSSPAISRRAPSVSSVASATQEERRSSRRGTKGRAMRDDVVSKSVRGQSAAVESVKADDDDEVEDTEKPTPRTTRRRGTIAQETPVASERRGTRAAAKTALDDDDGDDDDNDADADADVSGDFSESKTTTASTPIHGTRASASATRNQTSTSKASQKVLLSLLDTISSHRNGNVFQNPVKKSDAPSYYEMIKRPMDLKTIRAKIKEGQIATIDEFERDTLLIFANAMMFNGPKSHVYAMAKDMLKDAEGHIRHFKSVQHHVRN